MANWNPMTGLSINDTSSLAYEWTQKFGQSQTLALILMGAVVVGCLVFLWVEGKRKNKTNFYKP